MEHDSVLEKESVFITYRRDRKTYIQEVTRLIFAWINDTQLKEIALKAVHVMPALLLQKPSKK